MAKEENLKDKELEMLRARVKELEEKDQKNKSESDPGRQFYKELEEIKRKGKKGPDHITYKEILDYTPVHLWHKNGLRIGKYMGGHQPANVERIFRDFERIGIIISIHKPTAEEIERYQQGEEYKKLRATHDKELARRQKSLKSSEVDRLTEAISKMAGVKPQEVTKGLKTAEEAGYKGGR